MEDGVEVTVIVDLDDLDEDETSLLCLEGIGGDWILLSWDSSREAHQKLLEKRVIGRFGETRFSTPAAQDVELRDGEGRRIFHMDLRQASDASAVRAEIAELREAMSVKTLNPFEGLGLSGSGKPEVERKSEPSIDPPATPSVQPPAQQSKSLNSEQQPSVVPSYEDDDELDDLLDQLDELD